MTAGTKHHLPAALPAVLARALRAYHRRRKLLSVLRLASILVLAVGVGFLLLSILLPMFQMISNISAAGAGGK